MATNFAKNFFYYFPPFLVFLRVVGGHLATWHLTKDKTPSQRHVTTPKSVANFGFKSGQSGQKSGQRPQKCPQPTVEAARKWPLCPLLPTFCPLSKRMWPQKWAEIWPLKTRKKGTPCKFREPPTEGMKARADVGKASPHSLWGLCHRQTVSSTTGDK